MAAADDHFDECGENPDFDDANIEDFYDEDEDMDIEDDIEDFYGGDDMPLYHHYRRQPRRKGLKRTIAAGVVLVALLLGVIGAFLFMFVPYESANYISSNSPVPVAWITAYKTQQTGQQIYVQMTYRTAGGVGQTLCGHINNTTFGMYGEWTEFAGFGVTNSAKGFRWIATDGHFSTAECQSKRQTLESQGHGTSLNSNEDGLYRIVSQTPVISKLIGTADRSVFVGPITNTTPQNYVVYLSPNGTVSCDLVK